MMLPLLLVCVVGMATAGRNRPNPNPVAPNTSSQPQLAPNAIRVQVRGRQVLALAREVGLGSHVLHAVDTVDNFWHLQERSL